MIKYFFCFFLSALLSAQFVTGAQFERHDIPIQAQLVNCLRQVPLHDPCTPAFTNLQIQIHNCISRGADFNSPSQYFFISRQNHMESVNLQDPLISASLPWIRGFFSACDSAQPENYACVDGRLLTFFQWATSLHQGEKMINLSQVSPQVSSLFLKDLLTNYNALQTVYYLVSGGMRIYGEGEKCPLLTFLCSNPSSFSKTPYHFAIFKNLCNSIISRIKFAYASNQNCYYIVRLNDCYLDSFLENYARERISFYKRRLPSDQANEALFDQEHPYFLGFYAFLKSHDLGYRL